MRYAILLVGLAGCAAPAADERQAQQAYMESLQERCANYGFRRGTDAFAMCVRDTDLCEKQRKDHAFAWNQALIANNKPGRSYLEASTAATRSVGQAPVCR